MTNCNGSKMGNKFPTVPWPQPRNIFIHPLLLNCLYFLSIYLRRGDGTGGAEVSLIFLKIGEIVAFNTTNISRSKSLAPQYFTPSRTPVQGRTLQKNHHYLFIEDVRNKSSFCSQGSCAILVKTARTIFHQSESTHIEHPQTHD